MAGLLPHEFIHGSCGTYEFPEERVMFCFGTTTSGSNPGTSAKKCFRWLSFFSRKNLEKTSLSYNGKYYDDHPDSAFSHYKAPLGNIENKVVAIGNYGEPGHKSEIFDIPSNKWTTQNDYEFCQKYVFHQTFTNFKNVNKIPRIWLGESKGIDFGLWRLL